MAEKLEVQCFGGLPRPHYYVGRNSPLRLFEDESDAHLFAAADGLIAALEGVGNDSVIDFEGIRAALDAARVPEPGIGFGPVPRASLETT